MTENQTLKGWEIFYTATRPPDHAFLQAAKSLNANVRHVPLLRPIPRAISASDNEKLMAAKGYIFTSANGVITYRSKFKPAGPAFCVGARTALEAGKQGFEAVYEADNDSKALLKCVLAKRPKTPLCHFANEDAGDALAQDLSQRGVTCHFIPAYRTLPKKHDAKAWRSGDFKKAIFIHSQKGAEALLASYADMAHAEVIVAISNQAMTPLQQAGLFKGSLKAIASKPGAEAMLEAFKKTVTS